MAGMLVLSLKMAGFITQVRRVCCSVALDVALSQEAPCLLRVAAVFYSMGAMEGARTLVEEARRWSFMHGVREVWDSLNECKPAFFCGKKLKIVSLFTFFVLLLCLYLTHLTLCNTSTLWCLRCTGCGWILQLRRSGAE